MKLYFSGSIRGGRELQPIYQIIHDHLSNNGYTVLTHHVASKNVIEIEDSMSNKEIYTQDIAWLRECDSLIAEVSIPSIGVGYEISYALRLNKPVLGVYQEGRTISAMISGNTSSNFTLRSYQNNSRLLMHITDFLDSLKSKQNSYE